MVVIDSRNDTQKPVKLGGSVDLIWDCRSYPVCYRGVVQYVYGYSWVLVSYLVWLRWF